MVASAEMNLVPLPPPRLTNVMATLKSGRKPPIPFIRVYFHEVNESIPFEELRFAIPKFE